MRGTIAAALIACAGLAPADGPAPPALRVLTYNIHHGEGTDGKLDLPRVAGVVTAARPDVVLLQEVDRNTTRTGRVDQAAELARLTGLHAAFGQAIDLQGGGYGLTVLSRFPLKGVKTDALPGKAGQEARVVMRATVEPGGGWPAVTVLNTHFQHDDGPTREMQAAKLNELFAAAGGAVVLGGDLNATPDSPPIRALQKHWSFATEPGGKGLLTIPAGTPRQQIDYVLYRPAAAFRAAEARVIDEPVASDHRPVLAVLERGGR
jgi:endonuclease/exonuclease/phosphatase family metal-dependent hydrolase